MGVEKNVPILILIVTPSFPPNVGGVASYFSQLIAHLPEHIRTVVLTTRSKTKEAQEERMIVHRMVPNLILAPFLIRLAILPIATFLCTIYLLLKYHPRLIHTHSSTSMALGVACVSFLFHIPLIYDVQDLQTYGWLL